MFFSFQSQLFCADSGFSFSSSSLFFIRCTLALAQKHVKDRGKGVGGRLKLNTQYMAVPMGMGGGGWVGVGGGDGFQGFWIPPLAPRSGPAINPLRVNLNICLKKLVVCIDQEQDCLPTQMDPAGRGLTNILVFY